MPYDYIEEYQKQDDETIWEFRDKDAQSKIDTSSTETDYANPLSLETMQAQLAKNTKIKLEPIQDLHGYDKPWVGGAGKNLLPMTVEGIKGANAGTWTGNSIVMQNVTITILTDSDNNVIGIKMNGTAQNEFGFNLTPRHIANFPAGNYTYNIQENVNLNYFWVSIYAPQAIAISPKTEKSKDIIVNSGDEFGGAYIYTNAGNVFNNVIIQPMLRLSSESDATFQPYTNIASISGRSEIDILGCGKNLLPNDIKWYRNNSGNFSYTNDDSTTRIRTTSFAITSGDYILSGVPSGSSLLSVRCYDINKNRLSDVYGTSNTFTLNDNVKYIHLLFGGTNYTSSTNTEFANANILLEKGNQPTDYEPYTISNDLSIDFPSTVYGGVLDLESGELVVDRKIEDFGNLNYGYDSANTRFFTNSISDIKYNATLPRVIQFYSSCYNCVHDGRAISQIVNGDAYIGAGSPSLYIHDYRYDGATLNDFKTAVTGQTLCYKLATPTTIQLTPSQLYLLKNQNNLATSQYTQIKVTYRNGVFATLEPVSEDNDGLMSRLDKVKLDSIADDATKTESSTTNGNIKINGTETQVYDDSEIKGELSTDTTTIDGNPLNFTTLSAQTAKSTILSVEPIQDLHGYDKPWVGGAGKQLIDFSATPKSIDAALSVSFSDGDLTITSQSSTQIHANVTYDASVLIGKTFYVSQTFSASASNLGHIQVNYGIGSTPYYVEIGRNPSADHSWSIPANADTCFFRIFLRNGVSVDSGNWVKYSKLMVSVYSNQTYEPYENICPITGRTEIGILGCGKNRLKVNTSILPTTLGGVTFSDNGDGGLKMNGKSTIANFALAHVFLCDSEEVTNYVFYRYTTDVVQNVVLTGILCGASGFYSSLNATDKRTNVIGETDLNIIIQQANVEFDNVVLYAQLEKGTNATLFEPYTKSNDLTISLGQTVYGGTLDVENGVLVVDKATITFDGSSDENWAKSNSQWIPSGRYVYYPMAFPNGEPAGNDSNVNNLYMLSNMYNIQNTSYSSIIDENSFMIGIGGSSTECTIGVNTNISELTDFKTWLASNNLQVCYPLATPITINLTPHTINLLKGVNNISTDGDKITLTYRNGSVATLADLLDLEKKLTDEEPYGFIEHMSILDPAQRIEYIGKNKNYKPMTINLAGDHLANYNEWYDFPVIKENKPYMIKADGTVDYALDPNDYTKKFDGSDSDVANTSYTGGAFAWIPKTYKREFVVGDDRYVYISTKKLSDEYEAIGFIDKNGLEHDGAWIPMFYGTEITQDGTVKIMSLAIGVPTQNRNIDTQKTYLTNANPDTLFFGGAIVKVLTDIMIMLGKNSDIQAVFGTGNMNGGNGAQYMKDNACIDGGAFYGTTVNNVLNKAFHSLVLLTQNQWQRDPYTLCYKGEYIVSPYYKYDLTGDSYVKTGVFVTPPSSNNWVYPHKSVSVPHWGAIPVGPYSGSTTTGWADGQYTLATQLTDTTVRVVRRFAGCDGGRAGGLRCLSLDFAASYTHWGLGASPLLLSKGTNVR